MGVIASKNEFVVNGRTVLITGGSRGMGLEVGRQLAEKGASIVIVARDQKRLIEGIEYIKKGAITEDQRFHQISADLTSAAECTRVISETTAWNGGAPPDIVWCCAGSSHPTLFIDTPVSQLEAQMNSNYFSSAYMAHAALKSWLRPQALSRNGNNRTPNATGFGQVETSSPPLSRHLIFTASFLCFYTFAGYSPYSPTKAALRSLSDSLSQEMNLYAAANPHSPAVKIHTIFPATIFTESYEAENLVKTDLTKMLEESDDGQTAEIVARETPWGVA
ncbi:hypothetical protein DL768_002449 [Monosporascus sp. mg162]|nr:hypothetical protein DL768_002449 [Monosporascus sp. mg162]